MSQISLETELQSELDALSRRRSSLESDVLHLERKINAVNQNLQKNTNKEKMMSLIEFLETEKQRIQEKKLNKVNEKTKILMDKITNIRSSQKNTISNFNKSKFSRPKSFQQPAKVYDHVSRKYHSFSTSQPQTTNEIELSSSQSSQQKDESSAHLPFCMSMNDCQECTTLKDTFLEMHHEKGIDELYESGSENNLVFKNKTDSDIISNTADSTIISNYTFDSTKQANEIVINVTPVNPIQIQYCIRCMAEINEAISKSETSQYKGLDTQDSFLSKQSLDVNPSISASILAICDSYAYCECCNNNLLKIRMPTPSPSIVEIACKSHENCTKCMEALQSFKSNSLSSPKSVSQEIVQSESTHNSEPMRNESSIILKQDDTVIKCSRKMLCEEIEREIEYQNQLIFDTKEQISKISTLNESDDKLNQLRNMLQIENLKLGDMKSLAKIEEQKPNLWQKPFITENY